MNFIGNVYFSGLRENMNVLSVGNKFLLKTNDFNFKVVLDFFNIN